MNLKMPRQKPSVRILATSAILVIATICASGMLVDWTSLASSPMIMALLCPHCLSLLEASVPIARLGIEITVFLERATLIGALIFGLCAMLVRWWKSQYLAAAIRNAKLTPIPSRLVRLTSELQLTGNVSVILSKEPLAFCYGLVRPQICLSTGLIDFLTDAELRAVLCHEYHHQRTYAPLRLFAADSLAATFFFLPIFADLRNFLAVSVERAADKYAVELAGRSTLARALYRLLNHPLLSSGMPQSTAVGLSVTSVRIAELLGERTPHHPFSVFSFVFSIALVLGLTCLLWPAMIL